MRKNGMPHPFRAWRMLIPRGQESTLESIARKVACSPSYLCKIENRTAFASPHLAARLSRLTNGAVPIEAFCRPNGRNRPERRR
jgi:hypothetical protein